MLTSTKLEQIDSSVRHMLTDLHRNVSVTAQNREQLLVLASELVMYGQNLRTKVMRKGAKLPASSNDNARFAPSK